MHMVKCVITNLKFLWLLNTAKCNLDFYPLLDMFMSLSLQIRIIRPLWLVWLFHWCYLLCFS